MRNFLHLIVFGLFWMILIPSTIVVAQEEEAEEAVPVTVTQVQKHSLSTQVPVAGTVHSRNATQITSGLEARLEWVAEPGDFIEQGTPVARFDCDGLELRREEQLVQIRQEQIRLESLTLEVQRLEQADIAIPATQLAQLRADRDLARTELSMAKVRVKQTDNDLERCVALAPFSGVVTEQRRREGEDVDRGEILAAMTDIENLEVRAAVPIRYLPRTESGVMAQIRLNDQRFDGRVRTAVPAADATSQTFEVRIDLPSEAPNYLAAGQLVSVSLPLSSDPSLTVPRDSIVLRSDGAYVMRIDRDNKAQRVQVHVAEASGEQVSVQGDLNPGDLIALRGAESLDEGASVVVFTEI